MQLQLAEFLNGRCGREGVKRLKVDWEKDSIFCPPDRWFHQHFITSREPAKLLAFHPERSRKYQGVRKYILGEDRTSVKLGGAQIEYEDEDPAIRKLFKEELAKTGAPFNMSKYFPGDNK